MSPAATPRDTADWCAALGETLTEVVHRVGLLAQAVAVDWADDHGREWAERTAHVRGRLAQDAVAADDLAAAAERRADPEAALPLPPPTGRRLGVRLGGTAADRVPDGHGVRIAELPDEAGPPG